jgi:hypothetical protein
MDRSLDRAWEGVLILALLWVMGCQSPPRFKPVLDDSPVKPGDVLLVNCSTNGISVPYELKWVVDNAGDVRLPYSGPWRVAGKKPSELDKQLSQYFSVGRTVTFKIENIGPELSQAGAPPPPAGSQVKKPALASPKAGSASAGQSSEPPPKPPHPDDTAG